MSADAEAAWRTIAAQAHTLHGRPDSTIKPRERSMGTTGRGVLDQFLAGPKATSAPLELGPVLGEGGMGVVRLATQTSMGREVAVKSLRPHQRKPGPTLKLLQEAWTAARLEHPNIVPVYDITVDVDGSPLIVLKRIEGESWATLLGDPERLRERYGVEDPLEWHLQILSTICSAIHFAHDRGVLHLDLKPENVMIGGHGEVYVVDWGIAMALADDGSGRLPVAAACREIVGTPSYMAPEMLDGDGTKLGVHTDVYLLGAMLHELIAGAPPHRGETIMAVLHAALTAEPELPEGTPTELANICRVAMARAPERRYASADALRRELSGFLRHRESDRLATRASERLTELEALLAQPERAAAEGSLRDELFGQVRFGFEQALASWTDNQRAREGLTRAIRAMVEYELEHGDPQVAATLAGRAEGLPTELVERLARAVERRRAGLDELVQMRRDNDLRIGQRTRVFVISVLGVVWTAAPFLAQFAFPRDVASSGYLLVPIASLVILVGLAIWARESLTRTRVNRTVVAALALALIAHLLLMLGAPLMGLSYYDATALLPLLWAVLVAMGSLTFEPRATPIAVAYAIGFFAAAGLYEWRFLVMGVCNLVFVIVLLIAWWPQRLRGPMPELDHRS
ncbi:MAG TPA: serine/threonine-protein kinase [Enhygromyxa sp.]|nr:serine/threonine-protein kinase [Enhygromyxa sp.]